MKLYRLDNRRFFLDDLLMSCSRSYEGGIETRFLDAPDYCAYEAWEHMTYGGWACSILDTHRSELIAEISAAINNPTPLKAYFDAHRR